MTEGGGGERSGKNGDQKPTDASRLALPGREIIDPVVFIGSIVLLWEIGVGASGVSGYILPPPSEILTLLISQQAQFVAAARPTAKFIVTSFLIGGVFGILSAFFLYLSDTIYRLFFPVLMVFFVLPKIALAPLFLLYLGIGETYYIAVAFLLVYFPILENTLTGLRGVDERLLDLAALYHSSRWFTFRHVQLPQSLPHIGAGLKISVTQATIGVILAEIVAPQQGLGSLLMLGEAFNNTHLVFATIIVIGIVSVAIYKAVEYSLDRIVFWRELEAGAA